jgi:hypothetical protein
MNKHCWICGKLFTPTTAWQRYCGRICQAENYRNKKGRVVDRGRYCRQCGVKFIPPRDGGANKQHCSTDCAIKSARESRCNFYKRNPKKYILYNKTWRNKVGTDGNLKRLYLRYPNAPRQCQACGENRVLDIAHKPGHSRNGAWRSRENTTLDKIWILCPTCHALLDRKGYSPEQLGIREVMPK